MPEPWESSSTDQLGYYEPWDGWPEDDCGPQYWLLKRDAFTEGYVHDPWGLRTWLRFDEA